VTDDRPSATLNPFRVPSGPLGRLAGYADYVVAVNTAAFWPDLAAALLDARRVLRPGGGLLIAWHAAGSPRRIQRTLAQPEAWWDQTMAAVRRVFGNAERRDLIYTTACTAVVL
jgi:SAM-dependent methyltransferase